MRTRVKQNHRAEVAPGRRSQNASVQGDILLDLLQEGRLWTEGLLKRLTGRQARSKALLGSTNSHVGAPVAVL